VVQPNQTGFVPGRCIIDNIFLVQESIHYAERSRQKLALILLDVEKAYDRISWSFMREVSEKQGFHQNFIRRVMALYKNVSSSVIVNGEEGRNFSLSRSVR